MLVVKHQQVGRKDKNIRWSVIIYHVKSIGLEQNVTAIWLISWFLMNILATEVVFLKQKSFPAEIFFKKLL